MRRCCLFFCRSARKDGCSGWFNDMVRREEVRLQDTFFECDAVALRPPFSSSATVLLPRISTTEAAVRRISSFYRPDIYSYSFFSGAVLFSEALRLGLVDTRVDATKFFVHPAAVIRRPEMFLHFFGTDRSRVFSELLERLLAAHDVERSPVVRMCLSQGVDAAKWVPFLRGLCLCVTAGDPIVSEVTFVLEDILLGGVASDVLSVSGDYNSRGVAVADMLMEAAVEFGVVSVSELSLSVYRQFVLSQQTPYAVGKRLAVCITQSERRWLDWNLRCFSDTRSRK